MRKIDSVGFPLAERVAQQVGEGGEALGVARVELQRQRSCARLFVHGDDLVGRVTVVLVGEDRVGPALRKRFYRRSPNAAASTSHQRNRRLCRHVGLLGLIGD